MLEPLRGTSLLGIDAAQLATRLEAIPAVATAHVATYLPDRVEVTLTEESPAFVWRTSAVQLVGAGDGTVIGEVALGRQPCRRSSRRLPFIDDRRAASRNIILGDRIPADERETALRLAGHPAGDARLGGEPAHGPHRRRATASSSSPTPAGAPPSASTGSTRPSRRATPAARIDAQAASVRTLFAEEPERSVSWVDARNPGRVYWRAKG